MFKIGLLKNNKGSTLVASLAAVVVMAAAGAAMIQMSTTEGASTTNDMQATQAVTVGLAGLEEAMAKLDKGINPDVANKPFSYGTYTIITNPNSSTVTVNSQVGSAKRSQTINTSFASDAVYIEPKYVYTDGHNLKDLRVVKMCSVGQDCPTTSIISKATLEWNEDPCLYSGNIDYTPYLDPNNSNKVLICHVPPGNIENANTLSVSINGWENGHSGGNGDHNWDYLGPCNGDGLVKKCDAVPAESRNDGDKTVQSLHMENTKLYDSGTNYGTPTGAGAQSDETIVLGQVAPLTGAGIYTFKSSEETGQDVYFSEELPTRAWYRLTLNFADGSEISKSFISDTIQPGQPLPSEEDPNSDDFEGCNGCNAQNDDEAVNDPTPWFEEDDGEVTVDASIEVKLEVLGAEITYGAGGPEIPVYVKLGRQCSGDNKYSWDWLWNKTDVDGGEIYTETEENTGCSYIVKAQAKYQSFNETYSSTNTLQVRTLINGELAPPLAGFGGQKPITEFLEPLLDQEGHIVLQANQVVMLFELGTDMTSDPNSPAADFQDLVVLFTIGDVNDIPQEIENNGGEFYYDGNGLNILKNHMKLK